MGGRQGGMAPRVKQGPAQVARPGTGRIPWDEAKRSEGWRRVPVEAQWSVASLLVAAPWRPLSSSAALWLRWLSDRLLPLAKWLPPKSARMRMAVLPVPAGRFSALEAGDFSLLL